VATQLGRHYVLIDSNPRAVEVMRSRLGEPELSSPARAAGGQRE
jgi:DNA modification methylase